MNARRRTRASDAGSATVLVLGVAVLIIALTAGLVMLGAAICARHAAQAAADLAALAAAQRIGVDDGSCAAAEASAAANGVHLEICTVELGADGRSGIVEVQVSRSVGRGALAEWTATARARAQRMPPTPHSGA